jgi:hypothetical protein
MFANRLFGVEDNLPNLANAWQHIEFTGKIKNRPAGRLKEERRGLNSPQGFFG